jgi:hypothetical protein
MEFSKVLPVVPGVVAEAVELDPTQRAKLSGFRKWHKTCR